MKTVILDASTLKRMIDRIAHQILEHHENNPDLAIVGIKTRGAHLAKRFAERLKEFKGKEVPVGELGITFYRDDFKKDSDQPVVQSTEIGFDIENKTIIIVDDVLQTGRTVRCALDELIDFGRPAKIELAVLIDRGHRELPIRPDYVGKNVPTSTEQVIRLNLTETDGKDEVILESKNG
ncbi:MAG TPA: bifunctional pyr operon transcriptional regulator/uracil phosphoribosyltransferase PyrR [Elusimicrobiales bacterium]|nr:bifunctional pyr operon transcriptional regulator/uracil phosphoribosyltransferase PyrR [Elusimicrobiales bacterium]